MNVLNFNDLTDFMIDMGALLERTWVTTNKSYSDKFAMTVKYKFSYTCCKKCSQGLTPLDIFSRSNLFQAAFVENIISLCKH